MRGNAKGERGEAQVGALKVKVAADRHAKLRGRGRYLHLDVEARVHLQRAQVYPQNLDGAHLKIEVQTKIAAGAKARGIHLEVDPRAHQPANVVVQQKQDRLVGNQRLHLGMGQVQEGYLHAHDQIGRARRLEGQHGAPGGHHLLPGHIGGLFAGQYRHGQGLVARLVDEHPLALARDAEHIANVDGGRGKHTCQARLRIDGQAGIGLKAQDVQNAAHAEARHRQGTIGHRHRCLGQVKSYLAGARFLDRLRHPADVRRRRKHRQDRL